MTFYLTLIVTSILYRFRVIARFMSKLANFNPPHLHLSIVLSIKYDITGRLHKWIMIWLSDINLF